MYALTPGWEEYYKEQSPARRMELLEELGNTLEDDGANEFRKTVFEKRHRDPKNRERLVDRYLWQLVFLPGLYKKRNYFFANVGKELRGVQEELLLADFRPLKEAEKAALYWDIRNAADRYFATCSGARYGKKMFGLKEAEAQEKRCKACEDAWSISTGLLIHAEMEEELRILGDAVRDSYFNYDVSGREMFEEYDRKHREEAVKKGKRRGKREAGRG